MSDRADSASGARSGAPPGHAGSSSAPSDGAGGSSSGGGEHARRAPPLDEAEQAALEQLEESGAPPWGAPSNALHGLLRKLGAGLDDLLPSISASHSKLKTILAGLKSDEDGRQLMALNELCELLSIGTEDSMSAMSVDVFVPLLVGLLRKEHNLSLIHI